MISMYDLDERYAGLTAQQKKELESIYGKWIELRDNPDRAYGVLVLYDQYLSQKQLVELGNDGLFAAVDHLGNIVGTSLDRIVQSVDGLGITIRDTGRLTVDGINRTLETNFIRLIENLRSMTDESNRALASALREAYGGALTDFVREISSGRIGVNGDGRNIELGGNSRLAVSKQIMSCPYGGPQNIVQSCQQGGYELHYCVLAKYAHEASVLKSHMLNSDVLREAGCPKPYSRTLGNRLLRPFTDYSVCELADGRPHKAISLPMIGDR